MRKNKKTVLSSEEINETAKMTTDLGVKAVDIASGKRKTEPKPEPKDVEIKLLGDLIIRDGLYFDRMIIRKENMPHNAIAMTQHLLESITGVVYKFDDKERLIFHPVGLRDYLIQILEEKSGLKIKICGNCKNRSSGGLCADKSPKSRTKFSYSSLPCREHFDSCSNFEPKEISEETPRLCSGQEK